MELLSMKFVVISIAIVFSLVFMKSVLASPPQRLIIYFDSILKKDEQHMVRARIKKIIETDYTLMPHSSQQKWIIQIPRLPEKDNLVKIINRISELEQVKFVEPDHVLGIYPQNMN